MTFYLRSYQQRQIRRLRSTRQPCHKEKQSTKQTIQWVFLDYANYHKRHTQGLHALHWTQSRGKLMARSLGCAIKQAPTLSEGKDKAFSPKASSPLRTFFTWLLVLKTAGLW